jgi:hypothetical protein
MTKEQNERPAFPGQLPAPSTDSSTPSERTSSDSRGTRGTGTHNDRAPCRECGGPKEPGTRKMRCGPCIAKWYYTTPSGEVRRRILCRCGNLKEQGKWYCDDCKITVPMANSVRHRNAKRDKYLQTKYGINQDRYMEILELQGGVCAICGTAPPSHKHFDVDHCHKTGALRGLLCGRCNQQLLPISKDNPELLRAAAAYLEREPLGWVPDPKDLPAHMQGRDTYRPLKELPQWMGKGVK